MADPKPIKWIYDRTHNTLLNSDGQQLVDDELKPNALQGQKFRVNLQIVEDFDLTAFTGYAPGMVPQIIADDDYDNPSPIIPLRGDGSGSWTQSGNDATEFYYTGDVIVAKPAKVWIGGSEATEGTPGSLGTGEWGWGDPDATGTNHLYVRISGDSDPDTEDDGYVEQKQEGTGSLPYITAIDATVQANNSWYDDAQGAWRSPEISEGEISFLLNANTVDFYNRLNTRSDASITLQVQILDASAIVVEIVQFAFKAKNRYMADAPDLEYKASQFYTKTEADSEFIKTATSDDIEWTSSDAGPILTSPNGTRFRVVANNNGIVTTERV